MMMAKAGFPSRLRFIAHPMAPRDRTGGFGPYWGDITPVATLIPTSMLAFSHSRLPSTAVRGEPRDLRRLAPRRHGARIAAAMSALTRASARLCAATRGSKPAPEVGSRTSERPVFTAPPAAERTVQSASITPASPSAT